MTRETQTRGYAHDTTMKRNINYEMKDGTARSFTLVLATGLASSSGNQDLSGIVLFDNDHDRLVMDGYRPVRNVAADSFAMKVSFEAIAQMDFPTLIKTCARSQRYRGDIPEVDALIRKGQSDDIRSNLMKTIHNDPEAPYFLPPRSRDEMVADILSHPRHTIGDTSYIAFPIRPTRPWNRTGRSAGDGLDGSFDHEWRQVVLDDPSVVGSAITSALSPYLGEAFDVFEIGRTARCRLEMSGENGDAVLLAGFRGSNYSFRFEEEMEGRLDRISDDELAHLWMSMRVLDTDLDPELLRDDVENNLREMRRALEVRAPEPEMA